MDQNEKLNGFPNLKRALEERKKQTSQASQADTSQAAKPASQADTSQADTSQAAKPASQASQIEKNAEDLYSNLVAYGKGLQQARNKSKALKQARKEAAAAGADVKKRGKKIVRYARTLCKTDKGYSINPVRDRLFAAGRWPVNGKTGKPAGKDTLKKSSDKDLQALGKAMQVLASTCSRLNRQASQPASSQPATLAKKPGRSGKPATESKPATLSSLEILTALQAMETKDLQSLLNKLAVDERARTAMETAVSIAKLKNLSN